ncbi:MAG: calcium-binding protein, partial [Rhodobacteraceae bacterium]|nr:calcium-binding protein [Paracoccaceae bacterium]
PDALFGEQGDDVLRGEEGDDRLNGGPGNDVIDGGDGADTLAGGSGFDTILAGPGDDILTGNFNADTFVIADGFGTDRITDFEATNDFEKIDLAGVASITDWDDLIANHLSQEGVEVWISPDSDDLLIIEGVDAGDLDPLDFLF